LAAIFQQSNSAAEMNVGRIFGGFRFSTGIAKLPYRDGRTFGENRTLARYRNIDVCADGRDAAFG
jgi:hypothetical protein